MTDETKILLLEHILHTALEITEAMNRYPFPNIADAILISERSKVETAIIIENGKELIK